MGMADVESLSPQIDSKFFFDQIGTVHEAVGEKRGKVAFLAGCINNVAFSHLNNATLRVLTQNGFEVHVPAGQGCCGALHAHAGYRDEARELARHNIKIFLAGNYDAVVTNAAGCGSNLKEYDDLLEDDAEYHESRKRVCGQGQRRDGISGRLKVCVQPKRKIGTARGLSGCMPPGQRTTYSHTAS